MALPEDTPGNIPESTGESTGESTEQSDPRRRRPIYRDWTVLQLAALVILIDQFTKYLVQQLLPCDPSLPCRVSFPLEGIFRFTHIHNTGSVFGILPGQNTPLIFVSFVGVVVLVLIYRSQPFPSNWLRLSLALQLGGAFGNLIDRLRLGYVTDFIDIGVAGWRWPVFNLADASIITGLVLLVWIFWSSERVGKERPAADPVANGPPGGDAAAQYLESGGQPTGDGERGHEQLEDYSTGSMPTILVEPGRLRASEVDSPGGGQPVPEELNTDRSTASSDPHEVIPLDPHPQLTPGDDPSQTVQSDEANPSEPDRTLNG